MKTSRLNGVLVQLGEQLENSGPSDGQLLEHFLSQRDESAFATLVRRHGPMVLGVCRRLLRNSHDAEDAFQATFLVLVRKAASIRPRELVGHWLYGVAYRTALKAKTLAGKRRVKERSMSAPETYHDEPPADWLPLLDEELQRLPDKYRLPLVLCDLDGKTRKEAARQLGWPDGTLSTRLTRARTLLAERLTKRGVTLAGGAALLTILHGAASAQVPAPLAMSTVKAAMGFAAGHATAVSASVAALTQGVLKTMLLSKLKMVVVASLILATVSLGVGAGTFCIAAGEQVQPAQAPPPPMPAPAVGGPKNDTINPAFQPPIPPPGPRGVAVLVKDDTDPGIRKLLPLRPMPDLVLVSLTPTGTINVISNSNSMDNMTEIKPAVNDKVEITPLGKGPEAIVIHRRITMTNVNQYSREDVQLYDTKGKPYPVQVWPQLLQGRVPAFMYADGEKPEPQHLKLLKEGTLIVVLTPPKVRIPPPAPEPTEPPISNKQSKMFKELQGEWRFESVTQDGNKHSIKPGQDFRFEIISDVIQMRFGPEFERGPKDRLRTFDVGKDERNRIDMVAYGPDGEGKIIRGIYRLEGDKLTLCSAPPGEARPTEFEAPKGSKRDLWVLRRVSKETIPPK